MAHACDTVEKTVLGLVVVYFPRDSNAVSPCCLSPPLPLFAMANSRVITWNRSSEALLLELVRERRILWDPTHESPGGGGGGREGTK